MISKLIENKEDINKTEIILNDSFLVCCNKWKLIIKITLIKIYVAGTCLLKKPRNKKKGIKNQKYDFFVLIANIKNITEINDKNAEWWSTKGVPLDGYASKAKQIE